MLINLHQVPRIQDEGGAMDQKNAFTTGALLGDTSAAPRLPTSSGLDGIVVAETDLSEVDGERGRLIIAGRDVEELALRASFEDVCAALWKTEGGAAAVREALGEGRARAFERLPALGDALSSTDRTDRMDG